MSKRRGLGKGLSALIPVTENRVEDQTSGSSEGEEYREIRIEDIQPAPSQARQQFHEEKLAELAASIKEHGVIQPVVLRLLEEGRYELIAGERRWRACRMLGYQSIPAIVKKYQDMEAVAVSLIENVQREDLNPLEEALAYQQLMRNYGLTQEEVSGRVGKSRPFVANMVRLLELAPQVKEMLADGSINAGHARALLAIHDHKQQERLALKIKKQQWSVRKVEKMVSDLLERTGEAEIKIQQINPRKHYVEEVESALADFLGAKVKLKEANNGIGKLEINYSSVEELTRILEVMLGKENVSRETF